MHRIKNELNKLISNTILIVQLQQLKTQTVPKVKSSQVAFNEPM